MGQHREPIQPFPVKMGRRLDRLCVTVLFIYALLCVLRYHVLLFLRRSSHSFDLDSTLKPPSGAALLERNA